MIEPPLPRFRMGQRVAPALGLYNDGSFPGVEDGALLVPAGAAGEIVQIGVHLESGTNVYMVEFGGPRVIGCREDEIVDWNATQEASEMTEVAQ